MLHCFCKWCREPLESKSSLTVCTVLIQVQYLLLICKHPEIFLYLIVLLIMFLSFHIKFQVSVTVNQINHYFKYQLQKQFMVITKFVIFYTTCCVHIGSGRSGILWVLLTGLSEEATLAKTCFANYNCIMLQYVISCKVTGK